MITPTYKETERFMKELGMETPRTTRTIISRLRDNHKRFYFNEKVVEEVLTNHKAESLKVGTSNENFWYIDNWSDEISAH